MINDEKVIKLINEAEFLFEELPKGFWRLIKLSPYEIWETPEEIEFEYVWVVAIIGKRCVFYDDLNKGFVLGHYDLYGEINDCSLDESASQLNYLIEKIINSRFIVS